MKQEDIIIEILIYKTRQMTRRRFDGMLKATKILLNYLYIFYFLNFKKIRIFNLFFECRRKQISV